MLIGTDKNWDLHVVQAEEVARSAGFRELRDRILDLAEVAPGQDLVDVGAGTGLLSLAAAERGANVWAIDISPAMCDYLATKAASAGSERIDVAVGSAVSLPLVDGCADVVVSNYCFHHVSDDEKDRALREAARVLRPGGRLVFADMMFSLNPARARDRAVVASKVRAMLRKGPAGVARLTKNALRLASGRWEHPAPAAWWEDALRRAGFVDVVVESLDHEGGLARGRKP